MSKTRALIQSFSLQLCSEAVLLCSVIVVQQMQQRKNVQQSGLPDNVDQFGIQGLRLLTMKSYVRPQQYSAEQFRVGAVSLLSLNRATSRST